MQVVDSMSPVWLEQQQFEYIGELAQVWLEVQHRNQVRPSTTCCSMKYFLPFSQIGFTPKIAVAVSCTRF